MTSTEAETSDDKLIRLAGECTVPQSGVHGTVHGTVHLLIVGLDLSKFRRCQPLNRNRTCRSDSLLIQYMITTEINIQYHKCS